MPDSTTTPIIRTKTKRANININVMIEVASKLAGPGRLNPEGEKFLKDILWELRQLEEELRKSGLNAQQMKLLGTMRLQRQLLWMLIPETEPADAE